MDYKSVFTNLCLELQQNRSWIKGLGKNPQKSELIHWRQCLLSGGTEACSLGLRETPACIYTSSNVCHSHKWRVDTASGKTLNKRNACLYAVRQAVEKNLRVYTASEAKGLRKACLNFLFPKSLLNSSTKISSPLDLVSYFQNYLINRNVSWQHITNWVIATLELWFESHSCFNAWMSTLSKVAKTSIWRVSTTSVDHLTASISHRVDEACYSMLWNCFPLFAIV